jgi:uncharacterized membrane protein
MKRFFFYLLVIFYVFAGAIHFWNPDFYYPLIPPFLSKWMVPINIIAGVAEIIFGVMMLFPKWRRMAVWGIISMLVAFIPSHVYFIMQHSCVSSLCTPAWLGWLRLLLIHPLLIAWVWWVRKQ